MSVPKGSYPRIASRPVEQLIIGKHCTVPDTRLDRGGRDVGSSGGWDGGSGGTALRRAERRAGGEPGGALERASQGAAGAQTAARRVVGSVGAGDGSAGRPDRRLAGGVPRGW